MDKIIVYTSAGCSRCMVLKTKLRQAGIEFEENKDLSKIIELGFEILPVMQIGEKYLNFKEALQYIQEIGTR